MVRVLVWILLALTMLVQAGADYYQLLGVKKSATSKEIKQAYRELSRKYHPDKNPGDKEAEEKFVKMAEAYEALYDDEKRRIYDQYGEEGLKKDAGGGGFNNPFDIFSQFNGGGFGRRGANKGPDVNMVLDVTLEDIYLSANVDVEINKRVICERCRGSGAASDDDVKQCSSCGGQGVKYVKQQVAPGFFVKQEQPCNKCGGKGKIVTKKCPHCGGGKVRRGSSQLTIEVEKGAPDHQTVVFERYADQGPDITPGDVRFTLSTEPHSVFTRRGDNLYVTEVLSLKEALLGFTHELSHLDGHIVSLTRDKVTQDGFVDTLPGEGMPVHNFPSDKGVLYVQYEIVMPAALTDVQKAELAKIL